MRQEVVVRFAPARDFTLPVPPEGAMDSFDARRWLDEQFVAEECEPLRASGKVLTVDKILALAGTVGPQRFETDAAWGAEFARAVLGALARPTAVIDVDGAAVSY